VEYRSFQSLKHDKTKHARTVNEPLTRAAAPMLSSQSYGWEVGVLRPTPKSRHP
jgi:hypothetical protein